ncbi:MAG: 4Fe-4S dicluster domain-containing protein [Elusimicrobiota bacterium]|jgi:NAD-dependent dihydropyrimidine dehydrogenase PreA subunit
MEKFVILKKTDLAGFLNKLSDRFDVFVPVKKQNQRFFQKYTAVADNLVIGEVRPFEPLKAFFSRARERIAEGFSSDNPTPRKPQAIVGVKACDLKGLKIQDHVFKNHGFPDPFYNRNRVDNLIISADCTCAIDTCFCLAVGVKPYPTEDFDLNLSLLEDRFLVEAGSDKGSNWLQQHASLFKRVTDKDVQLRDEQRVRVVQAVEQNLKTHEVPNQERFSGMIERNFASGIWEDEAKTCVECGACTQICPTCHCFLLYDQKEGDTLMRSRVWDSCMLKDYARVAGGANPRKRLWMRLRNRFEKKFDFFPKVAQVYACTGCGRCITACPAKIDIRRVLKRLVNEVSRV